MTLNIPEGYQFTRHRHGEYRLISDDKNVLIEKFGIVGFASGGVELRDAGQLPLAIIGSGELMEPYIQTIIDVAVDAHETRDRERETAKAAREAADKMIAGLIEEVAPDAS